MVIIKKPNCIYYPGEIYPVYLIAPKPYVVGNSLNKHKVKVNFTNLTLHEVDYIYCRASSVDKVILPVSYYEAIAYTNDLISIKDTE